MFLGFPRSFIFALALGIIVQSKTFNNTIYVISNAETPSLDLPGLTLIGALRAEECLPQLFAPLDIGIIITCPFDPESGKCASTIVTALPTANWLGVPINTSCGADEETDDDCVTDLLKGFAINSTQSALIIWDLGDMDSLFENLDIDDDNDDDDDDDDDSIPHYDILTTVVGHRIESIVSQGCSGIDGQAPGTLRRRSAPASPRVGTSRKWRNQFHNHRRAGTRGDHP